SPLDSLWWI
nr:Chain B, p3A1 [synthetic construct]